MRVIGLAFRMKQRLSLSLYNAPLPSMSMVTVQADKMLSAHLYIPARIAISYKSFKGLPGYGEVSAGFGVQTGYEAGDAVQAFADVQLGANVQGVILRAAVGLDYALSEGLALRASIAQTYGEERFRPTSITQGLTSRFSLLNY